MYKNNPSSKFDPYQQIQFINIAEEYNIVGNYIDIINHIFGV